MDVQRTMGRREGGERGASRLTEAEIESLAPLLRAPEWSRAADDWPLPEVDALEAEWAAAHGCAHAVAVSSGTAALTLALRALGLPEGDEVIIPAYGCPAVDVAVLTAGLTPLHVDVDPHTYCLSPAAAAAAATPRTGALVAVHFAGQPAGLAALARVAERCGLALVEDACLAPGAAYDGRPVGSWGRAAAFSLGCRKPISAGEGGLVVTHDGDLAAAVRRQRGLGMDPETGEIDCPTGNYRLSALAAAVARLQLARAESCRRTREEAAVRLTAALDGCTALRPLAQDPRVTCHAWSQFWLRAEDARCARRQVELALRAAGVPVYAGWPRPNYCLRMYTPAAAAGWLSARGAGRDPSHYERTCCPAAERAAFREALLLDFPQLAAGEAGVARAVEAIRQVSLRLSSQTDSEDGPSKG